MPRGVPKAGKRKPRKKKEVSPSTVKETKKKRGRKPGKVVRQRRTPIQKKTTSEVTFSTGPEEEDVWLFQKQPQVELPPGFKVLEPNTRVRLDADSKLGIMERRGFVVKHEPTTRFCYVKWNDGTSYWVAADIVVVEKVPNKNQSKFYKQYDGMEESVKDLVVNNNGETIRRVSESDSADSTRNSGESRKARKRVEPLAEAAEAERQKRAKELTLERATSKQPRIRLYEAN